MTDRELIELAAKAAGIDVYESTDGTIQNRPVLVFSGGGLMGTMPYEVRWNPLLDDAQAFRLAVKLRLRVEIHPAYPFVSAFIVGTIGRFEEPIVDNEYAATRRAITRAAAEIGKAMESDK